MRNPEIQDARHFLGVEEAKGKVLGWLEKVASSLETEGELKVTLSQVAKAGSDDVGQEIYDYATPLDKFVDDILDMACEDAKEIGRGKIKYSVEVAGIKGRICFAITVPEIDIDGDFEDLEELPNRKGLITQQMRHTEAIMKTAVSVFREMNDMTKSMMRDKDHRIEKLERGQVETIKAFEELISMRHVRDMEFKKIEKEQHRRDQVAHVIVQGLPLLASKFLGGGTREAVENFGGRTPLESMLESLVMTFDQGQLMKLAQSDLLSPDQKANLMEMIKYVMERQQAEEAEAKKREAAARGGPTQAQTPPPQPETAGATAR